MEGRESDGASPVEEAADGPFCFWPRAEAQMSMPSHITSSLYAKMFCLTSYYNCADSRYEGLQNTDGPRETKFTRQWNWATSV